MSVLRWSHVRFKADEQHADLLCGQGDRNRTDLSAQMVSRVDVSNMTQPEAKRVLHGLYDLLVADNSSQLGLDDRVAALLFKMAYVSSVDDEMLTVSS